MLALLAAGIRDTAAQSTFTTASGNQSWGTAANWSPSGVPGGTDASVIFLTPVGGNEAINSFGTARTVGSMSLTNNSTSTFTISTTNTLVFDVSSGNATLSVAGTGDVTNTFNSSLSITLNDNLALSVTDTATAAADGALKISGVISGAGGIIKSGAGTATLGGVNTYTGGLTVQQGTLRITTGSAVGQLPASYSATAVVLNGGTLDYSSATDFNSGAARGFSIGSAGGGLRVSSTGSYTISAIVADVSGQSGALTKAGTGTLLLNAVNTYSGGTTIASGVLEAGVTSSLGSGAIVLGSAGGGDASLINYLGGYSFPQNITVAAGSGGVITLGYTSTASFSSVFSGGITLNDNLTLRSDSIDPFALRITGAVSGSSNLTKTGTGTVRLEANNPGYSGTTTISAGILQVGNAGTTGDLGTGPVADNGVLRINRTNALTLGSAISGSGSVLQAGTGTLTLSAANSFSGGASVGAGTLLVTNSTGSATGTGPVVVATGTTLGGTGTIAPTGSNGVTIGGAVSPGVAGTNNGVGTLTFTPADGNVTFQQGSSLAFDIHASNSFDRLVFNASGAGALQFGGMSAGSISVSFAGYTPALNDSFDLIDWTAVSGAGETGLDPSLLANLPQTGFQPGWTWDTSHFASNGTISIIASVPEPGRCALLCAGLACVGLLRRRSGK